VLDRIRAGETLLITDRGKPLARISPAGQSRYDELVAQGTIIPAKTPGPMPEIKVGWTLDRPLEEILAEEREDRL